MITWEAALNQRTGAAKELPFYKWPSDSDPSRLYLELEAYEKKLVCPHGSAGEYDVGTAVEPDAIGLFEGSGSWIVTSEHATSQQRLYPMEIRRRRKEQEYGIAAIGQMLHDRFNATHMTMLGRQTADPNNDAQHPFKDMLGLQIKRVGDIGLNGMISLHGMTDIKTDDGYAKRPYDIALGIGDTPSKATEYFVEVCMEVAKGLGLKCGVNVPFVIFKTDGPLRKQDGTFEKIAFNAAGQTTRAFAESFMHKGIRKPAAVQIELSSALRWMPREEEKRSNEKKNIGVALGYTVIHQTLQKLGTT